MQVTDINAPGTCTRGTKRLQQSLECAVYFLFGLLITDRLEFWHMVVLGAAMGCVFPLIMPARQAIVVNIVGKRGLGSAMALNMAGVNIMRVLGPAAAGFLIFAIGVEAAYAINLGLYAVALIAMLSMP